MVWVLGETYLNKENFEKFQKLNKMEYNKYVKNNKINIEYHE